MGYINYITEENKFDLNKPINSNKIYYSELNNWFTTNAFRSFSIKYVVDGVINYKEHGKYFDVTKGTYLLATPQPFVSACFESTQLTKSICIDICPALMNEAYTVFESRGYPELDDYLDEYFKSPHFYDRTIHLDHSLIETELKHLYRLLASGDTRDISDEWFLHLTEKLLVQEFPVYKSINSVPAKKPGTRKEIYDRVLRGKEFIDEYYKVVPEVSKVASHCNLSPFHFFRSFKKIFHTSPYQYMLNRRLEFTKELLDKKELSVSDIANKVSFPDVYTFSKAFKRKYGVSPKQYRLHKCY